ncbi:MAG: hypothetical protein JRI68_08855 [Deltaproteobacteria bacterium]|nr:hypothetical protein [Deltaproteobacteria bacterium]
MNQLRPILRPLLLTVALATTACSGTATTPEAPASPPRMGGYPMPGHFVPLLTTDNPRLPQTAALVARTGNDQEKAAAGAQVIHLANTIGSDAWRAAQRPAFGRMNNTSVATKGDEERWLDGWQKRHLVRVYDALDALGGPTVLDHCRKVAKDEERRPAERQLALGVLSSHGRVGTGKATARKPWDMPTHANQSQPQDGYGKTTWPGAPTGPASDWSLPEDRSRRADAPRVSGGKIINVDEVVDALRPYFRACYLRALHDHGRFGAWIIVNANVRSTGRVASVKSSGDESVPYSMIACLEGVVRQASFVPPVGGSALVSIPLAFTAPATNPAAAH